MKVITILALLGLLYGCVLLSAASRILPLKELKRRARGQRDPQAASIYALSSHGSSAEFFLWAVAASSAAGILLLAASYGNWPLLLLSLLIGWIFWNRQAHNFSSWRWRLAAFSAQPVASLVSLLQPVLGPAADWLEQKRLSLLHTNIYEKEDLLELIKTQDYQSDNRISQLELKAASGALTFGDKIVGDVMTPRRVVKMVAATDAVGPLLMDELHASGFSRFPVVKEATKSANPEIIGMLYLHDLVGHGGAGRVRDVMKKKVYFINETQNLKDALKAFIKTEHHLLVVVNNFEEITGVITIEDVIEQILGEKIVDEFDRYDDMRAVAGVEAKAEQSKHSRAGMVE